MIFESIVQLNSLRDSIQRALVAQDRENLQWLPSLIQQEFKLDILSLTDEKGRVVLWTRNPSVFGDDLSWDPFIVKALAGQIVSGTGIIKSEILLKEGEHLAAGAYLKFIPTPKESPRAEEHEEKGLMLMVASPIINSQGKVNGFLYGGLLLNRNYEIVNRVKDIVGFSRPLWSIIGIAAYEPFKDINDKIICMLYGGMLEKPYIDLRNNVSLLLPEGLVSVRSFCFRFFQLLPQP